MTGKGIIVVLSVVAVLGVLAAIAALSFTAAPTAAQEQQPTPPPPMPPTATPTPDPAAAKAIETVIRMEGYCHDGQVHDLNATVADAGEGPGKTVTLEWWADLHYWELEEKGIQAYYRIQRQSHDKDDPTGDEWQVVATVHTTNVWEGPVETGHWHYRVGLIGLVSGDLLHECEKTQWAENIFNVLTPQEELDQHCESAYIYNLTATVEPSSDGQGETVTLEWRLDHDYRDLPDETVMHYRVERMRDASDGSGGSWETVAEVSAQAKDDWNTWSGPGEPGDWIYRVALVSLQAEDLVAQCEKPHWDKVEVRIPTAEEQAREKNDRRILIAEATTCATDTLTENLSPDGKKVVARHVEERVSKIADDIDDNEQLVSLTVLFCADGELFNSYGISYNAQMYLLLILFDRGYF